MSESGSAEQEAVQATADRLSAKLQAFYEALPEDERQVMVRLLNHFSTSRAARDTGRARLLFILEAADRGRVPSRRSRQRQRPRSDCSAHPPYRLAAVSRSASAATVDESTGYG